MGTQATIETKYRLIQLIMSMQDERQLQAIERGLLQQSHAQENHAPSFWEAARPIQQAKPLAQIAAQQGYKPMSYSEFREQADAIEITEDIQQLYFLLNK